MSLYKTVRNLKGRSMGMASKHAFASHGVSRERRDSGSIDILAGFP